MYEHGETMQDDPTAVEFNTLLRRLDAGAECAGKSYKALHGRLVSFFQWGSGLSAEDLADVTFNRVARRLVSSGDKIHDVESFLWGVARKVKVEARRRNLRVVHLEDLPNQWAVSDAGASTEAIHRRLENQRELQDLNHCLLSLPEQDRKLFLEYRFDRKHDRQNRERLAKRFGITHGALRIRVMRIRKVVMKDIASYRKAQFISCGPGIVCRKKPVTNRAAGAAAKASDLPAQWRGKNSPLIYAEFSTAVSAQEGFIRS